MGDSITSRTAPETAGCHYRCHRDYCRAIGRTFWNNPRVSGTRGIQGSIYRYPRHQHP